MTLYAKCPDCGDAMEVEWTHNGVCPCLHGVHCGWGQDAFDPEQTVRANSIDEARAILTKAETTS